MAKTSGTAVLSLREYLERTHGAGSFARAVARLPENEREQFSGILQPQQWYSTAGFVGIVDGGRDLFGPPDFADRYGEFAASYELNFFHKFVLRFTSPIWILQRGAKVWRTYHDTGEWHIDGQPRRLVGELREFGLVSPTYCRVLIGWLRRAGQLTGARDMKIEHPKCRATGAEACHFVGTW